MITLRDTSTPYQVLIETVERMVRSATILRFKPRQASAAMTTGAMQRLVFRRCIKCKHEYVQAADTGLCPVCHQDTVVNIGEGRCEAPYRK